ncbi:MAG TPA: SGNH/GDSL hydrolase family protein [Candidatus Binatia bacterium]|jgi:hypothetical protein|nr:SGNH/GDSL hydrolase family protein [Candidatus Binatia bacterium]
MGRSRALTVVLVMGSLVLGLVASEGLARLGEAFGCRNLIGGWEVRNRDYGWGNRPGVRGWAHRCVDGEYEWQTYSAVTAKGLRGDDVPYERTGAYRVLLLGDSFLAGFQVPQDETFAALLARHLNAAAPPGTRIEVVNAAVSAWGTDNELLYYEIEGRRYRPDLVLLAFDTTNDVFENGRRLVSGSAFWPDKPYFDLHDGHLQRENHPLSAQHPLRAVLASWASTLQRRSAAFRLVSDLEIVQRLLILAGPSVAPGTRAGASPLEVYLRDYPAQWRDAWRVTRGLILRLRQLATADGARFAVMIINAREEISPSRWEVAQAMTPGLRDGDVDKPHRLLTDFLTRRDIPFVAMRDEFRAAFGASDGLPGFFGWDLHWAPAGHALAAEIAARELEARGLVPSR